MHVHNLKANGKEKKYLGLFSLNFMLNVQRGNALSYVTYFESGRHIANRSPKGNMWSAIPVALICMIVKWSERKQGSGLEGDEVL